MQTVQKQVAALTGLWGGTFPVLNSPMPDVTTPEMVAEVSRAGGLGVIAGDFLGAEALKDRIQRVRALTDRPFAVNLRARDKEGKSRYFDGPEDRETAAKVAHALGDLAVDLGLSENYEQAALPDFEEQLETVLAENVGIVTVSFGGLREIYADKLEAAGVTVIGAATTLREVKVMRSAGVRAVIVQGLEAGGPRLNFELDDERSGVGLMSLIGPAARASGLPVVAAGGIATGRQLAAALVAGASGAMLGTALIRTPESSAHVAHKALLEFVGDTSTILTRVYDGRQARVIENGLIEALKDAGLKLSTYPNQWKVMYPLVCAARAADRDDLMPFYAGQGADQALEMPVADILQRMKMQAQAALDFVF